MAKGTLKVFNALPGWFAEGGQGSGLAFQASGSWRLALISDSIVDASAAFVDPTLGGFNEVANGATYTSPGQVLTTIASSDTSDDGNFTFKLDTATHTDGIITIASAANGATNIKTAVIHDNSATFLTRPCVCFIDLTEDGGTTPISLQANGLQITFGAGGNGEIFKVETNN